MVAVPCVATGVTRGCAGRAATTVSGIRLDAPWKSAVYTFARAHFHHAAWGWQHSERDYRLALEIARREHLKIDTDVLFAAAMLHDMAAFPPWEKKGVEHGDVAAVTSAPVLRAAGFPMRKYAGVAAAERGHMFYSNAALPEAIALHDADSLDFLGVMGVTRMLAITGEGSPSVRPVAGFIATLRQDDSSPVENADGSPLGRRANRRNDGLSRYALDRVGRFTVRHPPVQPASSTQHRTSC